MTDSFIKVSLAQAARNLSIGNLGETTTRKTISNQQKPLDILVKITQEFTLPS